MRLLVPLLYFGPLRRQPSRRAPRAALTLFAAAVAALALAAPPAGAVVVTIPGGQQYGVAPQSMTPLAGQIGQLDTHGGPVVHSGATYAIYWDPAGEYDGDWQHLVNQYLQDVATDSSKLSNVFATTTAYTDTTGARAAYSETYRGSYVDPHVYPSSGNCTDTGSPCITDAQIRAELNAFIASNHLSTGMGALYFVLTPPGVTVCTDSANTYCSDSGATNPVCSYHSAIGSGGSDTVLYAVEPWSAGTLGTWDALSAVSGSACQAGSSHAAQQEPNQIGLDSDGDFDYGLADLIVNQVSVQQAAMITNPLLNGWWDSANQREDADMCRNWFQTELGGAADAKVGTLAGNLFDQVIGGHHYYLNTEWINAGIQVDYPGVACMPGVNLTPSFTVPTAVNVGDVVALDGSETNATLGAANYHWDFGDGTTATSTQGSVVHSYARGGTFSITLTVTDRGGNTQSTSQSATVVAPPPSPGAVSPGSLSATNTAPKASPSVLSAGGPRASSRVASSSVAGALKNGLQVRYTVNEEMAGRFELILDGATARRLGVRGPQASGFSTLRKGTPRPIVVGSAMLVTTRAGSDKLAVHFSRPAAARLRRVRSLKVTLRLSVVDLAGKRKVITQAAVLHG